MLLPPVADYGPTLTPPLIAEDPLQSSESHRRLLERRIRPDLIIRQKPHRRSYHPVTTRKTPDVRAPNQK